MTLWKKGRGNKGDSDPPERPQMPQAKRFIVNDTTVEALAPILLANPRGLLMARDELSGWIGSFDRYAGKGSTSTDAANWLSMFNAGTVIVDRKTGNLRTIYIPQAAVNVCGGIQPAILRRALSREYRESGLAARLLLTYPPRRARYWSDDDTDPVVENDIVHLFSRLYDLQFETDINGQVKPVVVQLDAAAKSIWEQFFNAHADEHVALAGDIAAAWSKLEEYAARLALIVHFIRWAADDPTLGDATTLDASSMTAGITLTNWFKTEARRVYAILEESDDEYDQRRLEEWIARNGGVVSVRDVQRGCRWLRQHGDAERALEELVQSGRGYWRDTPTTKPNGQPARRFCLATIPVCNDS